MFPPLTSIHSFVSLSFIECPREPNRLVVALINVRVSNDKKTNVDKDEEILEKIAKVKEELKETGRVVIRASGTEPIIRVMIEGKDEDKINKRAQEIADLISIKLN